jgi:N6-L-threonylcarbamoyladenine synthase
MKILAIETSCDDTGIAILEVSGGSKGSPAFNILANIIASQIEVHQKYGGVYPMMAKREHQLNLVPVLVRALKQASLLEKKSKPQSPDIKILEKIFEREPELLKKIILFLKNYKKPNVDFISVTNGPGLEPCLWTGVNFAKALSLFWNIPVIPVNHIESHILVNLFENPGIKFPAIALVVSGGHTQIILVNGIKKYKILGETRDDAAGECFDKCAKILGLGYPGGPILSKLAEGIETKRALPRPMITTKDYDFSFSGLKTAVLYADRKVENKSEEYKKNMAAEVQQAIIDVLIKKTMKAVRNFNAKSLILGGGVSANQELRKQFKNKLEKESPNTSFFVPKPNLSTDNALMTAITGFYHKKDTKDWQKINADGNLRIR